MTFEGWRDDLAAHQRAASEMQREAQEWHRAAAAEHKSVAQDAVAALREADLKQVPVYQWVWRQPTPRELRKATRHYPAHPKRIVLPTVLGSAWVLELPVQQDSGFYSTHVIMLTEAGLLFTPPNNPHEPPARARFWEEEPFWPEGPFHVLEDMSASSAHDHMSLPTLTLKKYVVHTLRTYAT